MGAGSMPQVMEATFDAGALLGGFPGLFPCATGLLRVRVVGDYARGEAETVLFTFGPVLFGGEYIMVRFAIRKVPCPELQTFIRDTYERYLAPRASVTLAFSHRCHRAHKIDLAPPEQAQF